MMNESKKRLKQRSSLPKAGGLIIAPTIEMAMLWLKSRSG